VKGELEAWSQRGSGWVMKFWKPLSTRQNISHCAVEENGAAQKAEKQESDS